MIDQAKRQKVEIHIAPQNIFMLIGIVVGIWLAYSLIDVLILIFVSVIIASALGPMANWVHYKIKLNFELSLLSMYLIVLSVIGLLGYIIFTPLVIQGQRFIAEIPSYVTEALVNTGVIASYSEATDVSETLWKFINSQSTSINTSSTIFNQLVSFFSGRVNDVAQGAVDVTVGIFSLTLSIVFVLVFSFYLLLEKKQIEEAVSKNLPFLNDNQKKDIIGLINAIEDKLGRWSRGQGSLCLIIGTFTYIGLSAIGIEYALPLAVLAGLMEFIPIIGPVISAVPAILVTLAVNWQMALIVALLYLGIQQLENNLIVPWVMKRAVGFSPILSILAILVGGTLMGIMGALLAVPVLATIFVIMEYYAKKTTHE